MFCVKTVGKIIENSLTVKVKANFSLTTHGDSEGGRNIYYKPIIRKDKKLVNVYKVFVNVFIYFKYKHLYIPYSFLLLF